MPLFKKTGGGLFSSFKGTEHSERLRNTFEETQQFKRQLQKAEVGLKAYEKATEEVLKLTDDSVTAFPRVWRKDHNIATSPNAAMLPEEDMAKPAPTTKKLSSYPSHKYQLVLSQRCHEEVYVPMEAWHKQYQHMKLRIASVEGTRLEYDSARKDLGAARDASLKHARKTDGKIDPSLVSEESRAEAVLASKRQVYIELEEEVHVELLALAADSQNMLQVVQRALLLNAEALADAAECHREREAEMPMISRQSSGPLQLDLGNSVAGSPMASPVGTPTYGSTPPASFRNMNINESGTPTRLSNQGNRFDESAAITEQQRMTTPVGGGGMMGTGGGMAGVPAISAPTGHTGQLKVTNEVFPAAPSHGVGGAYHAGGIQQSAEFPSAPGHTVNPSAQGTTYGDKREAFLEQH